MEFLGIAVLFLMAGVTAGQSSCLESPKLSELWINYLLALMSIVFGVGFALLASKVATGDVTNMRLLMVLALLPCFFGVVLNNWAVRKMSALGNSELLRSRKTLFPQRGNLKSANPAKAHRAKRSQKHENEARRA